MNNPPQRPSEARLGDEMSAGLKEFAERLEAGLPLENRYEVVNSTSDHSNADAIQAVELRQRLRLTQADFARLLAVSVRTLATLESGTAPTEAIARRLTELERLTQALGEVIQVQMLGNWLKTPNNTLDGLKSLEVIERGETDRLWSMIDLLGSGVPS